MAGFESFWLVYPRKEGKAACLKKWEQKRLDDLAEIIVAHVTKRAKEDKKWKDGFIPMPLTFLNQERWTDEYETVQYRQPQAANPQVKPEEVWPQPCQWQAAANRILFAVLQAEPLTPASRLDELVRRKRQMGGRLAALYGDRPAPVNEWRKISEDGFNWLLKAARGNTRPTGEVEEGAGESERAAA